MGPVDYRITGSGLPGRVIAGDALVAIKMIVIAPAYSRRD
jgi:hypothetical protein